MFNDHWKLLLTAILFVYLNSIAYTEWEKILSQAKVFILITYNVRVISWNWEG